MYLKQVGELWQTKYNIKTVWSTPPQLSTRKSILRLFNGKAIGKDGEIIELFWSVGIAI
jgi:hypothetical protein